ncbi:hypothetical protein ACGFI9_31345 [Micromonospora sp. NPDC048930]|uniref:hypothetical protein n=1 Tax=Micromonospora sp. NPDC048930 TaxID=3364261 RepID=UPI003711B430
MTALKYTTAVTINLVTVATLQRGLDLLGLRWRPAPTDAIPDDERGLYGWVIGRGADSGTGLLNRAVAYVGVGMGDGGLLRRLRDERSWVGQDATHGHGRAMFLLQGEAVGGACIQDPGADLSWLDGTITADGYRKLVDWLTADPLSPAEKAERLCVRMALHIGDIAPPVNSQYAGVWNSNDAWDWGGWAVAARLRAESAPSDPAAPRTVMPAG